MPDLILRHEDILATGEALLLTRAYLTSKRPKALHGHDFYELIWVQNGTLRHHMATGRTDFAEGSLLFIRPQDHHALQGRGEDTLVVSLTFHPDVIGAMGDRHAALRPHFFWQTSAAPTIVTRDFRQMADLNRAALVLERGGRSALQAEAFLLPLCVQLLDGQPETPEEAPEWLKKAMADALSPDIFRDGAAGFARAAGRAHPHVSRTMRKFMGLSPSDYINQQRMAFAARRLIGTEDSLSEIAADCGIPNLSHFHKLFREQFGTTPQRYRKTHQAEVLQPIRR